MNGPAHYAEAERLLSGAMLTDDEVDSGYEASVAAAQVHATLALAAATALPYLSDQNAECSAWDEATS